MSSKRRFFQWWLFLRVMASGSHSLPSFCYLMIIGSLAWVHASLLFLFCLHSDLIFRGGLLPRSWVPVCWSQQSLLTWFGVIVRRSVVAVLVRSAIPLPLPLVVMLRRPFLRRTQPTRHSPSKISLRLTLLPPFLLLLLIQQLLSFPLQFNLIFVKVINEFSNIPLIQLIELLCHTALDHAGGVILRLVYSFASFSLFGVYLRWFHRGCCIYIHFFSFIIKPSPIRSLLSRSVLGEPRWERISHELGVSNEREKKWIKENAQW